MNKAMNQQYLWGVRTKCPRVALAYAAKGSSTGPEAFTLPWDKKTLETRECNEVMEEINYHGCLTRRVEDCQRNMSMKCSNSNYNRKASKFNID